MRPAAETPLTLRGANVAYEARTNQHGEYILIGAVPGHYRIEVRAHGYRQIGYGPETPPLQEGSALRLDAILKPGRESGEP